MSPAGSHPDDDVSLLQATVFCAKKAKLFVNARTSPHHQQHTFCCIFCYFSEKTGIVHGDCHINNILKGANGAIEAFDFERCFIPLASVSNSTIENFITSFVEASSPDHLTSLLKSAKSYGLNRTRDYFTRLADACLSDPSNVSIPMLFTLDADALAQTFRGSTQ